MDDDLNLARRHRFGATASDTLQARIDITESDAEQFEPVPLVEQAWRWKVAGLWLLIMLFIATFFAGILWWVRMVIFAAQALGMTGGVAR